MTLTTILMQLVDIPPPESVWPTTVAGWVGLCLAASALVGVIYGFARTIERLNGYGKRQAEFEATVSKMEGNMESVSRAVENMSHAVSQAMKEVGEAKRTSENCNDNTRTMEITLGAQMHEIVRSLDRLVTELRVRGHIEGPPIIRSPGQRGSDI